MNKQRRHSDNHDEQPHIWPDQIPITPDFLAVKMLKYVEIMA